MYAKYPLGHPLKICEFPFNNDDLVLTIILPNKDSIESVESQLNSTFFDQILAEMRPRTINTTLPVFSVQSRVNMRTILESMDLSEICQESVGRRQDNHGLFISQALYECNISIGSKLVSADDTSCFLMSRQNIRQENQSDEDKKPEKCLVSCENPFLFLIRNRRNKLILYLGKLVSPVQY